MPSDELTAPPPTGSRTHRMLSACLLAIHLLLVLAMAWWAFILVLPVQTFPTSQSYWWFAHHWPFSEDKWSLIFLFVALLGLPGFLQRGRCTCGLDNGWFRIVSTVILAGAHGSVAWATAASNPGSTGSGVYILIAALALFRLGIEAKL